MTRYRAQGPQHLPRIAERFGLSAHQCAAVALHSQVLPFRTNDYVLEQLIDWSQVPRDPIFQMVFPQPGMLAPEHEALLSGVANADPRERAIVVAKIRAAMNPHPAGQQDLNVPEEHGHQLPGIQHKYAETVLYFPAQGQTCHAYCTYCFRWAQFIGDADLRFAARDPHRLVKYLHGMPGVSDVLVTGGDPMIMTSARLRSHLEPLLSIPTVRTIRLGTKALGYWPYRFTTDHDADDLMRLIDEVVGSGRTLAVMAHFSHPVELRTDACRTAIARLRSAGAVVYCQAPIMRRINDDATIWADMWREQLALGAVPYYQFMARDTGPRDYFAVPVPRAVEVFQEAYRQLPGLARAVRGPVMSTTPGKIVFDGWLDEGAGTCQVRFLQARDPALVGRPFGVVVPAGATWADQLRPMPGTPQDLVAALATAASESMAEAGAR